MAQCEYSICPLATFRRLLAQEAEASVEMEQMIREAERSGRPIKEVWEERRGRLRASHD